MSTTSVLTRRGSTEYGSADQVHSYADVSGLRVVARCAPSSTPKVVRVHADYGLRTVSFDSSRAGRPPLIPAPGDVLAGTDYVADTYLGGTVTLPTPMPNDKAGYNWRISGEYTYLQSVNRKAGTHCLPTGGLPFPVIPNDLLFNQLLLDNGVSPGVPNSSQPNIINTAISALAAVVVDHTSYFPWPLTTLPPQCATNGLIGA